MSELDALLAELRSKTDALAKSEAAPAAAETKAEEPKAEEPKAEEKTEAPKADEPKEEVAKAEDGAFEVTDAEGNKLQAVDGFALLKAMQAEIDALRAEVTALPKPDAEAVAKSFADAELANRTVDVELAKSLKSAITEVEAGKAALAASDAKVETLSAALAAQGEVVKSLSDRVDAFASEGTGRRSVVTLHERPSAVSKSEAAPTIGEIFAKANDLIRAGKLTGMDAARLNASVNSGRGVPADLAAVFAA